MWGVRLPLLAIEPVPAPAAAAPATGKRKYRAYITPDERREIVEYTRETYGTTTDLPFKAQSAIAKHFARHKNVIRDTLNRHNSPEEHKKGKRGRPPTWWVLDVYARYLRLTPEQREDDRETARELKMDVRTWQTGYKQRVLDGFNVSSPSTNVIDTANPRDDMADFIKKQLELIKLAEIWIDIQMYSFTDTDFAEALIEVNHKKKLRVRVMLDKGMARTESGMKVVKMLRKAGVEIRYYPLSGLMHIWVDGKYFYKGDNYEVGQGVLVKHSKDFEFYFADAMTDRDFAAVVRRKGVKKDPVVGSQ